MKIFTDNFLHVFLLINTFACDAKISENDLLIEQIKKLNKSTSCTCNISSCIMLSWCGTLSIFIHKYLFIVDLEKFGII